MNIVFDPLALAEMEDASEFYDVKSPGLGERFKKEIKRGLKLIRDHPEAWAKENKDLRRYLLHAFPYKIIYSIEPEYIYIVAVAHCHRQPDYWIDRIIQ